MNSQAYRQAYMANLNAQVANNNKNLQANRGQPALNQYVNNGGTAPPSFSSAYNKVTKNTRK